MRIWAETGKGNGERGIGRTLQGLGCDLRLIIRTPPLLE